MNKNLKLLEAKDILEQLGMPKKQTSDLCCYTLLSMCNMAQNNKWNLAVNHWIRIHDIIQFIATKYNYKYAENSRESFRKEAVHHFENAAIIENNGLAANNPDYKYRITEEVLKLIKSYKTPFWKRELDIFLKKHVKLIKIYRNKKIVEKIPIKINSQNFNFGPRKHNLLQRVVIEEFAPRFTKGAEVLYIGDAQNKNLYKNDIKIEKLGFVMNTHGKLPDIILYIEDRNWLFFIEAVTSVGPIDSNRLLEINAVTKGINAGKIFITAFANINTYKKFASEIAWETEVWLADQPEHMIHLNGNKFLNPR